MTKSLIKLISNSRLVRLFISSPTPKWTVFLSDLIAVVVSCLLTFYFNSTHDAKLNHLLFNPLYKTLYIAVVYGAFIMLFKTNEYIIRLSVFEDVYRIMQLVGASTLFISIISLIVNITTDIHYYDVWNVVIIGVFSFAFMIMVRLTIKYIYRMINLIDSEKKRVIVLGSAINSFVLASALKNEIEGSFNPVALLSISGQRTEMRVNGIPIIKYEADNIPSIFKKYGCDTLLFLSTQIELMRNELADKFLQCKIKLLMLNQVEEFDVNSKALPKISAHVRDIKIEDLLGREEIHTDKNNLRSVIMGQTVMITGAAGSIGSEIVDQVCRLGASDIVLVDQAETPMHELQLMLEEKFTNIQVHLFIGDVANQRRMEQAFSKYHPRYVFHAAAYKHVPMMERNPSEAILTNVFGTKNMADLAVKYGVEKFVMISTDKAVNPTNVMGASKRIAEIYVQSLFFHIRSTSDKKSTQFITTRFGNVLGSNGSVIPLFRRQIEEHGPVTVTHRDIIRYFMTIPEACSLVLEAGCMGNGGEIYVFDMGKPVKIYDLAVRMISLAGMTPGKDIEIVETGLRPGEKLYEELLNDKEITMATRHKKIMIAKVRQYDYADVVGHLAKLRESMLAGNNHDLVAEMKHMVPEYRSQNSIYENIDREIDNENELTPSIKAASN